MAKLFGIDVSTWQGDFNFSRAKAEGVQFAILRGAYACRKDSRFESYYKACKTLSIPVGVYHYSMAKNAAEAKGEANFLIQKVLKGKQFEYPIYMDVEDKVQAALGKDELTEIISTFCDTIEKAGYYVGIYSTYYYLRNNTHIDKLKKYDKWIAQWHSKCTCPIKYSMWQFGGETNKIKSNTVAGVVCDQDYAYVDFPKIMKEKGLNGFGESSQQVVENEVEKPIPPVKSLDQLAHEVIDGKWGNGDERKQKLTAAGYDYRAVQSRVNGILGLTAPVESTKEIIYRVQPNDTLTLIANKFGTTVDKLVKLNNIKNKNLIYVDQLLKIR